MRSYFEHNYYLKQRYFDPKQTKNHPKTCANSHSFCNIQYQWSDPIQPTKILSSAINPSIPNINFPSNADQQLPVNYKAITEQDLDDWIAQSLNRNIKSLLNPQKKYYVPIQFQEQLKNRYKKKSVSKLQEDIYFSNKNSKKRGFSMNRKNKVEISQLCFDYHKLEPKNMGGVPIRYREFKNKKRQIVRRNAVFLDTDLHYGKFVKEFSKMKQKNYNKKQQKIFLAQTDPMFYSFNLDNLKRKSESQYTPSSIAEKQFQRFKQMPQEYISGRKKFMIEQQKINENFRQKVMEEAKKTQDKMQRTIFPNSNTNNNTNNGSKNSLISQKKIIPSVIKKIETSSKQKFSSMHQRTSTNSLNTNNSIIDTKSIGKDKFLQNKVLGLLNDMQIISQQIDYQMSQLNIHVSEVMLKTVDSRPQSKWAVKGQQKLLLGQSQLAIDCYKQALIIQPEFFVPIFNIAVLLEKQKMYYESRKWFQVCKQFQIDDENVNFGLALINLKQAKFVDCFQILNELIKLYQVNKKQFKLSYYYMRALCAKKLQKYQLARSDFNIMIKNCKPANYDLMSQFIFGILFSKTRRFSLKFDCLSYLNIKQTLILIEFNNNSHNDMRIRQDSHESMKSLAKKLSTKQFFKRYSISLIQKLLINSKYQLMKPQSLIFIQQQQTSIILSGQIAVINHLKTVDRPQNVALLQQGGVIGGGAIDNHMSQKSNNWFYSKTQVELIKISRKSFSEFWKGQITFEFDFKYNFIKNVGLFKNLPESTLFNICEKIQKVTYEKGIILFNDCSYRNQISNKHGAGFGLGRLKTQIDPRFVNAKKSVIQNRKKGKYKLGELLKKHYYKIDQLKFKKLKYPGFFILLKGKIQIEDDKGFRCEDLISEREYFGENLFIESDGFHNYGRMVVASQNAQLYFLPLDKLVWTFTADDRRSMKENSKKRSSIDTLRFLRGRFKECQNSRINYQLLLQKH